MKFIKLPSIIGFMIFGVVLGPSLLNFLDENIQEKLSFITEIALGFVAFSIGLELHLISLKKLGLGIIYIILFESFTAFLFVSAGLYFLTGDLPLALIFGASAPAGRVAIIQEFKAKGNLTKALYAVVGFDDGLGIIIFGFAAAFARIILMNQTGGTSESILMLITEPLKEIGLSILFGGFIAVVFSLSARRLQKADDVLILVYGFVFLVCGISQIFHISIILTNMIVGMIIINTQPHSLFQKIHDRLPLLMPILFILFFTLAGSNLHLATLPSLGLLGIIYILFDLPQIFDTKSSGE